MLNFALISIVHFNRNFLIRKTMLTIIIYLVNEKKSCYITKVPYIPLNWKLIQVLKVRMKINWGEGSKISSFQFLQFYRTIFTKIRSSTFFSKEVDPASCKSWQVTNHQYEKRMKKSNASKLLIEWSVTEIRGVIKFHHSKSCGKKYLFRST